MGVNTYTALPNIIPGTLTVQGDLLVNGRTIRLGTSTRKLRIQEKVLNDVFQLSFNRDVVAGAGDDPGGLTIGWLMGSGVSFFRLLSGSFGGDPAVVRLDDTTGRLIVGEDELRVGGASPFVRVQKPLANLAGLSFNYDMLAAVRDDAASNAMALEFQRDVLREQHRLINSAGTQLAELAHNLLTVDASTSTHTGTTVETSLRSVTIPANILGSSGLLEVLLMLEGNVQGATASTFRLKLGGTTIFSFTRTAIATILWLVFGYNRNLTNSQQWWQRRFEGTTVAAQGQATSALDTTLDQLLDFTIQLGATTNSWDVRGWAVRHQTRLA